MNKILAFIFFSLILTKSAFSQTLDYDFSDTFCAKIPLKITERISTKGDSYEGQKLKFVVNKNVYDKDNKLLVKMGTIATARLEIITTRGLTGVPGEIFITDFEIPNLNSKNFIQPISKRGFDTTLYIIPTKIFLTPFFPLGSLANFMIGFNASLNPNKVIYLDYYPNYK